MLYPIVNATDAFFSQFYETTGIKPIMRSKRNYNTNVENPTMRQKKNLHDKLKDKRINSHLKNHPSLVVKDIPINSQEKVFQYNELDSWRQGFYNEYIKDIKF